MTAGGSVDSAVVGLSPTIVGDDLTRRAAHAWMNPVDGAFVLRGGGGPSTRVRTRRTACRADAFMEEAMGDERIGDNHPDIPPNPRPPTPPILLSRKLGGIDSDSKGRILC